MPSAKASAKLFVLDTSALLALKQDEPGADMVEQLLRSHGSMGGLFISFITLMEYFYIFAHIEGESAAREGYSELKQLPLVVIESDEELGLAAAHFKTAASLSVADAWIAATAARLGATLVHKDPEFDQLKDLSLQSLPYK